MPIPTYDDLFNPLLQALHTLGGSGSVEEIDENLFMEFCKERYKEVENEN